MHYTRYVLSTSAKCKKWLHSKLACTETTEFSSKSYITKKMRVYYNIHIFVAVLMPQWFYTLTTTSIILPTFQTE